MMNSAERAIDDAAGIEGGEKSFGDLTDLKNEDFIYVY
jgi:hypothetical protein